MSTPETPSEASNQTAVIESPGALLRVAREQRGMTPEQVSNETSLSPRYVEALETDNYAILPGQAFARGYLRRYAQLLRIDSDQLVPSFERLWQAQRPEQVAGLAGAAKPTARPAAAAVTPARLAGSVTEGVAQLGQQVSRISMSQLLSWGSLVLLLLLLAGTFFWQDGERSDTPAPVAIEVDSAPAAEPPAVEAPTLPAAEPATAMPATEPPAGTPAAPEATVPAATTPVATPAPATVIPVQPRPAAPVPTTAAPAAASPAMSVPAASVPKPAAALPAPTGVPMTTVNQAQAKSAQAALTPSAALVAPATAKPAALAKPVATTETVPASARIDALNFSFTGKSWISVRDATGQELVYGLKSAGQLVSVSGQPPFSINIGNVAATTLTRNGKSVNLKPYTRGEIASFRLNP